MPHRLLQFAGFCFVFFGIVLFCIVMGGYTSFWRSQNRIEQAKSFLTDSCQKRLDLLPSLIETAKKDKPQITIPEINQTARKANKILQHVISQKTPLEKGLIKEFEISQTELTFQLKDLFTQWEGSLDKNHSKQFVTYKKQFIAAQNDLFITRQSYNDEVNYFNSRATASLTSLFAKVFGFDKMNYIEISKDQFLPAKATFAKNSS